MPVAAALLSSAVGVAWAQSDRAEGVEASELVERPVAPASSQLTLQRIEGAQVGGLGHLLGLELPPGLAGAVEVELGLSVDPLSAGVVLRLTVPELSVGSIALGALELRVHRPFAGRSQHAALRLEGPVGRIDARAEWPAPTMQRRIGDALSGLVGQQEAAEPATPGASAIGPPERLDIRYEGVDLARVTALAPTFAAAGRASGHVRLDPGGLSAAMTVDEARWRGGDPGRFVVTAELEAELARFSFDSIIGPSRLRIGGDVPIVFDPGQLSLSWDHERPLDITVDGEALSPASLLGFYAFPPGAAFTVGLRLTARGPLAALEIEGELDGALHDGPIDRPVDARLAVGPAEQTLRAAIGEILTLELATQADLLAWRAGAPGAPVPIEGALISAVPLSTLSPFLPPGIAEPAGALRGRLDLAGTLGAPTVEGALVVEDGALTVLAANARITALAAEAAFTGDAVSLRALRGRAGRGAISGEGAAEWTVTPPKHEGPLWSAWRATGALSLEIERVPFIQPGLPAGLLDAAATVRLTAEPDEARLAVRIERPSMRLTGYELPEARAIAHNDAVQLLDGPRVDGAAAWLAGEGALGLSIELPEPLIIEGVDAGLTLVGTLEIERQGDVFTTSGGFDARSGRFHLFDMPFTITEGRLSVAAGAARRTSVEVAVGEARLADPAPGDAPTADPLDAMVDLAATGRVVDTDVFVRLSGPSRRPTLVLRSEPPLPEYQILTLLITGRVDVIDDRNGEVRRKAAALISRFHNPGLARQLYDRIGVDKLGLAFGASVANPILTVGKQINRQLYVETVYRHDAPPDENETEARVEYRLSPRWTVDTTAGDAGEGAVGLFWQTGFGRPSPPPEPAEGDEADGSEADSGARQSAGE